MYFYCYVYVFLLLCTVLYILFSSCQLALFGYPNDGFSVLFPQLQGKCQGLTREDRERPALFPLGNNFYAFSSSLILV